MVLCLAMMLSIMVVGAGAAFADQSDIDTKHQEAVDACSTLNIITGFENGKFMPNDNVTREQTAKMICVLLNGGKDPVLGAGSSSFTDVANNRWSCPYIESCVSQDIIVGVGNNKFAPAGKVTGSQLAKMLLVALGFSPDHQKYSGSTWEVNVNTDASARGFYKDLEDIDPSQPLTREHAAQMIWNALNANEVEYQNQLVTDENGQLTSKTTVKDRTDIQNNKITLLEDKFNAKTHEDYIIIGVKEDSKGTYTVYTTGRTYTKVAEDCTDLLGQKVDIMVKDNDTSKVLGIYPTDDNTVTLKTTVGQIDTYKAADKTIKVEDVKYNLKNTAIVNVTDATVDANHSIVAGGQIADALVDGSDKYIANTASTAYLVSNDGDNKIDIIFIIPAQVAKVTYVGSDEVTLGGGIGNIDTEDLNAYDGMVKGDFVLYTPENTSTAYKATAEKLEPVNGTINAVKGSAPLDAKIDGTYYSAGTDVSGDTPKANDSVTAIVYAGRYYNLDTTADATIADLVFVAEASQITSGLNRNKIEAHLLFADGSEATVTVSKVYQTPDDENGLDATATASICSSPRARQDYNAYATAQRLTAGTVYVGGLYTYEMDGNNYELTPVSAANNVGYDSFKNAERYNDGNAYKESKGLVRDLRVDDDAVIFVAKEMPTNGTTGASAKVMTGKELKTWGSDWGLVAQTLSNTKNGVDTVLVGTLLNTSPSYGAETGKYGIISSTPETVTVEGKSYQSFDLWNGSDAPQTIATQNNLHNNGKGAIVKFDTDGTKGDLPVIKAVKTIPSDAVAGSSSGAMLNASEAGSNKYDVTITDDTGAKTSQTIYTVDSDTTVLYINDDVGVKGDDITSYAADESAIDGYFIPNVIYATRSGDATKLDLLVIDVRGKLGTNSDLALADGVTNVDLAKNVITTSVSLTADSVKALFKAGTVLAVKQDGAKWTVVATDGTSHVFTVTVAPAPAVGN